MTKANTDSELRLTFTTSVLNVSSVLVAIEAEAFRLGLSIEKKKLGGVFEHTWGVTLKGKKDDVEGFAGWFGETVPGLCRSKVGEFVRSL